MVKIKLIGFIFFILHGCSTILEPIVIPDADILSSREDLSIQIQDLNFKTAEIANKNHYPRKLMVSGSGLRAKISDESDYLSLMIPESLRKEDYVLDYGDQLSFTQRVEFLNLNPQWPQSSYTEDYVLGDGDELTFSNFVEAENLKVDIDQTGNIKKQLGDGQKLIVSSGVIGSDGNILLLGIGNIQAANRTIVDVQNEARNILIRNGTSPNFQLQITGFNSKKAYLTSNNSDEGKVIYLNNIPISLKEIALASNISALNKDFALITLTRQNKIFRITAGQLFKDNFPEIFIEDKDQINIKTVENYIKQVDALIGSKGNILLPDIGSIYVKNKTISQVQKNIHELLTKVGFVPNFQLELAVPKSKKAYMFIKDRGTSIIPLANSKISIKDIIHDGIILENSTNGITVVKITRNNKVYKLTLEKILDPSTDNIWIQHNDQIEIEYLEYKSGQVFALSGAGNATIVKINPSRRETLANVLFEPNGALSNLNAKRSEIYLIRGQKPTIAYHLDGQDASKILVAAKTELRPNDIIYVADRAIISLSRLLLEISPLRILTGNLVNDNFIPE